MIQNLNIDKKRLFLSVASLLFFVFIIAGFFLQRVNTEPKRTSARDILGSTKSVQCRFKDSGHKGTIYAFNGQLKGEFTTNTKELSSSSNIVIKGGIIYVWLAGQNSGFIIPLDNYNVSELGTVNYFDIDKILNMECQDWRIGNSNLLLPQDVNFVEAGNVSTQKSEMSSGLVPDEKACRACDTAPEEYRANCRITLGCN